jgi:uncharacterized protein (TIGR02646 family)
MRTISRNAPPACLAGQPARQEWRVFMDSRCHADLDSSLRREQHGLCCYCELEVADGDGHIEHMEPCSRNRGRTYDYSNLAVSCDGGAVEHCGRYKDDHHKNPTHAWDAARFASPHDAATVTLFRYLQDGSIVTTAADSDKATYLIAYLGLDCPRLTERRKQQAQTLIDTLGANPDPNILAWLRQDFLHPHTNGRMKQFHSLSKAVLEP